jgi:hypothetical protein
MMNKRKSVSEVKETVKYDDLIKEVDETEDYEFGYQPPKPTKKRSPYPFTLKVHCWNRTDTEKFCVCIGKTLRSDKSKFNYTSHQSKDPKYIEKRKNPYPKSLNHRNRVESKVWKNTVDYKNDGWSTYITFEVTFKSEKLFLEFCRKVKQRLSLNLNYMSYPVKKPKVWKYWWVCRNETVRPIYPIYIISKNRGDSRLTSKCLERLDIPYFIVIEPQNYDEYSCMIDKKKILVLPYSNVGDGPGRARNWCWDHSIQMGYKRHWVMDDNITDFYRLYGNRKIPIGDGGMFRVCEEFVDRFENVPLSGLQYDFFVIDKKPHPPF